MSDMNDSFVVQTRPVRASTAAGKRQLPRELLMRVVEGALLAAGRPLTLQDLAGLFDEAERPSAEIFRGLLDDIAASCENRGFELREVASGFRFQVIQAVAPWVARLWDEKPQRYSRALLETLALVAYRQPITRGDIEEIRGVAVASNIMRTLLEREWVRVVGHKDVPGRPAMYATTRKFLDYFNLRNLDDLPALADIRDLDSFTAQLALEGADTPAPVDDIPPDDSAEGPTALAGEPVETRLDSDTSDVNTEPADSESDTHTNELPSGEYARPAE